MTVSSKQAEVMAKLNAIIGSAQNAITNANLLKGEISASDPVCASHCDTFVAAIQPQVDSLLAYQAGYTEAATDSA